MKTEKIFIVFFIFGILAGQAQENGNDTTKFWKTGGILSFSFNQVSFSNWAAGGENSYAINGLVNLSANYKRDNISWENTIDAGYGVIKQGEKEIRKSDDKLDIISKFGLKAASKWNYSLIFNAKAQFDNGYKYNDELNTKNLISAFASPAYLIYAAGMEYKPSDVVNVFMSPLSGKTTIVLDDTLSAKGAFGIDKGKSTRNELGGYVKFFLKKEIWKNVTLDSKIDLYSNYLEKPENIDINWEILIFMKINKYLTANLNTHLIYDDNIAYVDKNGEGHGPRVQFKELFGVGLTFKF